MSLFFFVFLSCSLLFFVSFLHSTHARTHAAPKQQKKAFPFLGEAEKGF